MISLPSFIKLGCAIFIGVFTVSGCLGTREWAYPPPPDRTYLNIGIIRSGGNALPAKLVVLPLEDLRGNEMKENYEKVAIPLVSHGVSTFDRPETIVDPEEIDELFFDPPGIRLGPFKAPSSPPETPHPRNSIPFSFSAVVRF